jgi:hypothetical protein
MHRGQTVVQDKGAFDEGLLAKRSINAMISERRSYGSLRKAFKSRSFGSFRLMGLRVSSAALQH